MAVCGQFFWSGCELKIHKREEILWFDRAAATVCFAVVKAPLLGALFSSG